MILYLFSIILFLSEVAETIDITSATQSSAFTASVTLSHGGSLRGLTTVFQSVPVDVFLGKTCIPNKHSACCLVILLRECAYQLSI